MATVNVTLPVDIAPLAAPVLLGYMFNWALFGALTVQVYLYHISFPKDKWHTKLLVYAIYCIEITQSILVIHDAFNAYAKSFGHLEELNAMQNEWLAVPVFSAIVSCAVQMYYAYRIGILSGSLVLRGAVSLIALTQGVAGLVEGAEAFIIGNFSDLATRSFVSTSIWLAGCAVCDIMIAICMAYYLSRNSSPIPKTQAVVTRLVRLVIETGTLTVDLILFLTFSHSAYHACVALILAKLYSNSLLVLFNSRIRIIGGRGYTNDSSFISYHGSSTQAPSAHNTSATPVVLSPRGAVQTLSGTIRVDEETWVNRDNIQLQDQKSDFGDKKAPSL
ncbi:hypothetical protein PHLGIDRAFT_445294 [Phlebiopsis gigantea 11061_1 CR5-6]|uniref:DUF6534 domain-containing protein n=1 Tax=Phlebiopsis gigantea (strain 11061_1 CR5-6) TaxID=745531 RepID=A0A0C3RXU4_PHLG1|nr:hypothetical protein PHLGIDRAFT_445294 [Phlebiopsis gigantea 11061_1 CR5-6]